MKIRMMAIANDGIPNAGLGGRKGKRGVGMMTLISGLMFLTSQSADAAQTFATPTERPMLANLQKGKLTILSFALYPAHYDSILLADRIESTIRAIGMGNSSDPNDFRRRAFYWKFLEVTKGEMERDALAVLAEDADIMLVGNNPPWANYPETVRRAIIAKLAAGTPLILFGADKRCLADISASGVPLKDVKLDLNRFPPIDEKPVFQSRYYRASQGLVAVFNAPINNCLGYLVSESTSEWQDEYKYRRVASLIYKMAKGIEQGRLEAVHTLGPRKIELRLMAAAASEIRWRLKDVAYRSLAGGGTMQIPEGTQTVAIELPELPNGDYGVELELLEAGKVADWISHSVRVEYNPRILSATLERDILAPGERLSLCLTYSDDAKASSLTLALEDVNGRCYYEQTFTERPASIQIPVPRGSLSVLNFIRLSLMDPAKLQDLKVVEFAMPTNNPSLAIKDFQLLLWQLGGDSVRRRRYLEKAYSLGVGGSDNSGLDEGTARSLARYNLGGIPYTTVMAGRLLDEHLFNEEWIGTMETRCRIAAHAYAKFPGPGYTLGDETQLSAFRPEGRFSHSAKVNERFRTYLRDHYGAIEKLNAQWAAAYASFDEIQLRSEKDLLISATNPSPWFDYRMFLTTQFMGLHNRFRDVIRSIDPRAKVGFDGAEQYSSYDGYDWYQYTRHLDLNNIYGEYLIKGGYGNKLFNGLCLRSFTDKRNFRGSFANALDLTWGMKYLAWYSALCQFDSVWWWTGGFLGPECEAFDIDLKPTPPFKPLLAAMNDLQKGPASLLKRADFEFSPIAIHYSENNFHASTLSGGIGNHINNVGIKHDMWFKKPMCGDNKDMLDLFGPLESLGHYASASKNFITLLHDLGYQPRMLARQEIETGALNAGQYKALVLPFVESLSDKEVEEIRAFVSRGGYLLADYRTAIRDAHGKILDQSPLDPVLGIERRSFNVVKKPVALDIGGLGGAPGRLQGIFYHPDLVVTSRAALVGGYNAAGVPIFISHTYGEGRTLFLNSDLYEYFTAREAGTETPYKNIFRYQFQYVAHIDMPYKVLLNNGYSPHTEVFASRDLGLEYAGIIRDYSVENHAPFDITVPFAKKSYVYELVSGSFQGFTDLAKATLGSGETLLFAQCPYEILGLEVTGKSSARKGSNYVVALNVRASNARALCNHTVNINVYGADHQPIPYLHQNLYLEKGAGTWTLPIALNDQKGEWRIVAREVVSGQVTTHTFAVR